MGRLNQFEVAFPRPKVFYAGQAVTGEVIIGLSEPVKISSISVRFVGRATVRYKGTEPREKKSKKEYTSSEDYINTKQIIYNSGDSEKSTLAEGTHKFPFSYPLLENLPTSYEAKDGSIRYWVKVTVDRPWKLKTRRKISPFTVVKNLDLNTHPELWNPLVAEHRSSAPWYKLWRAGEVNGQFHVEKAGFVPGEAIQVTGEINNRTFSSIKGATLSLVQNVEFIGRGTTSNNLKPYHNCFSVVNEKTGSLGPRSKNVLDNFKLVVPPVPPTDRQHCGILKIDYQLMLELECGHAQPIVWHRNITIGTIPLTDRPSEASQSAGTAAALLPPPYTGPPPEYQENAMADNCDVTSGYDVGDDDVTDAEPTEVASGYAPLYPVYGSIPGSRLSTQKETLLDEYKTNPLVEYENRS